MGLITLKELSKGAESITSVNKEHPKFAELRLRKDQLYKPKEDDEASGQSTNIKEFFVVTKVTLPIFKNFGFK